ncbi:MAG: 30S ribosomal protein S14 [Gammaproteobacteria bacterium]|jgi:small subunit ribosomal protein S14|nr:30S ribosomal protein S14 [Gammaproteobacteria bacterium]MBT3489366.1 30S ribosomal protein S14 [Gammaproteobacteria bacterium]MBT3718295.1 30S ribosomal protein S14 [Gammaproteobacteria bacterium]MBT3844028.1 30S ribosomal protein S14 [Gammaproteobacteria bacterium]MBT3892172.1 30S ribosomal protein S14 [Gammaproteobacteria bacterium]
MAKTSMIQRELRREKLVKKYAAKRAELKSTMINADVTAEERAAARRKFNMLPRDSSSSRLHNRCNLTGRPHGYYRKFGLSRNKLREATMRGDVPGLRKASW